MNSAVCLSGWAAFPRLVAALNTALAAGMAPKAAVAVAMYGVKTAAVLGEKSLEWAVKHPGLLGVAEGLLDLQTGTTPKSPWGYYFSTGKELYDRYGVHRLGKDKE